MCAVSISFPFDAHQQRKAGADALLEASFLSSQAASQSARMLDGYHHSSSSSSSSSSGGSDGSSLRDRLQLAAVDNDPIPSWLMRKYISYARKFVRPKLSADAKRVLGDFYLSLRKTSRSSGMRALRASF